MLRDIRSRRHLSVTSKLPFNTQNLTSSTSINLEKLLNTSSPRLQNWAQDKAAIAGILGDEDEYGGVNPGDRRALYTLIANMAPKKVLEVGTHIGASTLYIAAALKASETGEMVSVDILDVNAPDAPWLKVGLKNSPLHNVQHIDCAEIVTFEQSSSLQYLERTQERFNFIFLDGDHGAKTVYNEVSLALDVLAPGGVILLHDYYPNGKALYKDGSIIPGPYRALERIKKENNNIAALPLGTLPWPTKQDTNITSLALVVAK